AALPVTSLSGAEEAVVVGAITPAPAAGVGQARRGAADRGVDALRASMLVLPPSVPSPDRVGGAQPIMGNKPRERANHRIGRLTLGTLIAPRSIATFPSVYSAILGGPRRG